WVGTHEDITERRRAERELERTKSFLDRVIETVPATIVVKNAQDLRYVLVNRAGERLYGVPRDRLIGKCADEIFSPDAAGYITENDRALLKAGQETVTDQHSIKTPANGDRVVMTRRVPIFADDGKVQYLMSVIEDLTERKQAEEQIAHMANHDALTDLPNRAAFSEHLQFMLEYAAETQDSFAVMCIDLDRFKEVNAVFGPWAGAARRREVRRGLTRVGGDTFLARLSGDEYALIAGCEPAAAATLAERLLACMADEFAIDQHKVRMKL